MKKFSKRLLTFVLACAMVFGLSGMTAFAAETDDAASEPVALADDAASEPVAIDDDITYEDIVVYKQGDEVGKISGEDFAAAEAVAPEQTFVYYSGSGQSTANEVKAKFVLLSTLLAGLDQQPDGGCGISIPSGGASRGGQTYEDWEDSVYIYYDTENESYRSAVDGTVGGYWVSGLTSIVLGHDFNNGPYCVICGAVNEDYNDEGGGGIVDDYEPEYSWYNESREVTEFHIKTVNQLAALSEIVNGTSELYSQNSFRGQTVYLDNDLEMNTEGSVELTYDFAGEKGKSAVTTKVALGDYVRAFTPIGNMRYGSDGRVASGHAFEGTFDGQGFTIENLYVTGDEYVGLFGAVGAAPVPGEDGYGVIKNFNVTGVVECTGDGLDFAAGVCAKLNAGGTIQNVINYAAVEAPNTYNVGGIVGFAGTNVKYGDNDIYDAYKENPSGYNTFVLCCGNEATIHGYYKQGGIAGENAATLMYCYNTGWILPHATYKNGGWGGIVGRNGNNNTATEEAVVAYCYNTGTISNNGYNDDYDATVKGYAGIVGQEFGSHGKCEVHNCYNIGSIPVGYNRYNSVLSGPPEGAAVAVLYDNYTLDDPDRIHNYVDSDDTIATAEMESGIKVEADDFIKTSYGDNDILTKLGPYFRADKEKDINDGYPVLWWQVKGETEPVIESLQITTGADKTTYSAGELFDPTGMVVVATYQDGIREIVPVGAGMYDDMWLERQGGYSFKTDPLTGADTEIEVSYKGLSDKQKITVEGSTLDGITVTDPDKTIYSVGEYFDPTGMTITASFNEGAFTTKLSTDQVSYSPGLDHPLELTDTTITVTYELDGQTKSATVTINVSDEPKQDDEGRYLLSNVSEVEWYSDQVTTKGNTDIDAVLTNDIDISGSKSFLPIGDYSNPYTGSFDGAGYTLTVDIDISDREADHSVSFSVLPSGVIGYMVGGSVSNLTVDGTVYGKGRQAGVVGYADGGSVTNCVNNATITATGEEAGGVVGMTGNNTEIKDCINNGTVSNQNRMGGIVGETGQYCTISNCVNTAEITGIMWVGGIAGYMGSGGSITDCGNDAYITVTDPTKYDYDVGGIAGYSGSNITNSYNRGNILGNYKVGGIVGEMCAETIDSCYNTGDVTATNEEENATRAAGGIAGYCLGSSNRTNVYSNIFNTGTISGLHSGVLTGNIGSYNLTFSSVYYLDGTSDTVYLTGTGSGSVTLENVAAVSAEEIASEAFLPLINANNEFKLGGGHPLLIWEVHDAHTWGEVEWDWAEDYSSATASRTCTVCGLKETVEGEISIEITKEPTVSEEGTTTYTATATFDDGTEVENTRVAVTPKVDTTELNEAIDTADALNEEDYTASSWEAFETALSAAKQVVAPGSSATQSDVDEALSNLNTAMKNLVELADKDDLDAAIAEAKELNEADYTPASWEALQEALEAAETVADDEDATQEEVSNARRDLLDAMGALVPVADKTSLNAAITEAEKLNEEDYTPDSWAALTEALTAAEEAAGDPNVTQEAVDEACKALENAMSELVEAADKTDLQAEYDADSQLSEEDYTPASWSPFEDALASAKEVLDDANATQTEVDDALEALQAAKADLVEAGDKTNLQAEYDEDSQLSEEDYTPASWSPFKEALDAAKDVLDDANATQPEVDNALEALQTAKADLVEAGDKTNLQAEYDEDSELSEEDYTPASWSPFEEALVDAKKVLDDANATQTEVDNALKALQTAKADLVEAADKTDLENEITDVEDEMNALNKDDYTEESWEALVAALANAQAVAADPNATQEDVEAAEEALKTAKDNLEPVEDEQPGTVDKEDLEKEITDVEDEMSGLNKDDYTADSWEALEEALANAKEVAADPNATQDDVEAAEEALKTAKDNLEPVEDEQPGTVDKEELEKEITAAEDEMNSLNKADYTADSWKALEEALANAQAVAADPNATQAEVEAAEEALKTAMDNLAPAVKSDYTGFVKEGDKAYYMESGVITGKKQGIIKDTNNALGDAGAWYYVIDSEVQYGFTGLSNFSNENGWWYIKAGKVDFTRNSVDQNNNGWWYVTGGKVQFGYTGVSNYSNANGWWYIKAGKVDFTRNSVDQNKNGWWYVEGGKVRFGYTGVANYKNSNGWWYIKDGKVDFTRNSVDQNKNGWWYVTGGKVQFGYTGVANYKNANGWWYINSGKVDFTYNGRASNNYGTWNVAYGKVVF